MWRASQRPFKIAANNPRTLRSASQDVNTSISAGVSATHHESPRDNKTTKPSTSLIANISFPCNPLPEPDPARYEVFRRNKDFVAPLESHQRFPVCEDRSDRTALVLSYFQSRKFCVDDRHPLPALLWR